MKTKIEKWFADFSVANRYIFTFFSEIMDDEEMMDYANITWNSKHLLTHGEGWKVQIETQPVATLE